MNTSQPGKDCGVSAADWKPQCERMDRLPSMPQPSRLKMRAMKKFGKLGSIESQLAKWTAWCISFVAVTVVTDRLFSSLTQTVPTPEGKSTCHEHEGA